MLPQKLVFLDTETTGISPTHDRIIEIGLVRVEYGEIVQTYQTLLNPQMYLHKEITYLTGIHSDDLESAPVFEDIADTLTQLLDDAVLVAHNARFDYGFLKQEFARIGQMFTMKQLCTAKLSRQLFPQLGRHNLDTIIRAFGFECENRHRAFDDARVLWDLYQKAQTLITPEKLEDTIASIMHRPSLPQHVPPEEIAALPTGPGVYIFYGEQGMPLYVGKSTHIKERVLSHFASDYQRGTEMQMSSQVTHIETIPTAGELSALLEESRLIKSLQPLYNRKSRLQKKMYQLTVSGRDDTYKTITMSPVTTIRSADIPFLVGIFPSQKAAKEYLFSLREMYHLCDKLLGLEKASGACFPYRLGQCRGACIEKESYLAYNMRLLQAISQKKIKPWPFPGPIAISESDEERHTTLVVDNWCLVSEDGDQTPFDKDTYTILLSYIKNHHGRELLLAKEQS